MTWNAYHFIGDRLRDGSPVPDDGVTLKFGGKIKLCGAGYHASRKVWQALEYAPGDTLCRVYCAGEIIEIDDKLVCTERTIVARIDAEALLRDFARSCAKDVLQLWDAPDVVREYLATGDERLRAAARDATRAAARGAAWEASRAAAWAAAWDATTRARARDAARDAAGDAAWAAAGAAARDAARDAARVRKQRARLTRMVDAAFGGGENV